MIDIVYPKVMQMTISMVELMFITAVTGGWIPPRHLLAKTPQAMAEALDEIGWIRLASKQPFVISRGNDANEAR